MKRAIAVTELIIIILAVVAGVGLLFFTKQATEKVGCMRDVDLCRNSFLLFRGGVKYVAKPRVDCVAVSPPNCEERALKTDDKQKTMHIIAENLRWCWHKTLGAKNMMGEDFGSSWFGNDVDFCLVCSEFTPAVDITSQEWNAYLDERKITNSQLTYEQFIDPTEEQQQAWKGKWTAPFDYRNHAFEKGTRYYVVSVSAEDADPPAAGMYINPEVVCGTSDPQIHYQLK